MSLKLKLFSCTKNNCEFSKFLSCEKLNFTSCTPHQLPNLIRTAKVSTYTNFCLYSKLPLMCSNSFLYKKIICIISISANVT